MAYCVTNGTKSNIWLRDGVWTSGEIEPGKEKNVPSDHDANVTIFTKIGGENDELGKSWIPRNGSITVHGLWNWDIRNTNHCK